MSTTTGSTGTVPPEGVAEADTFKQTVDNALQSFIGRAVAGVIVPLALPLGTSLAYGLQKWFGLKLSGAALATYLGTIAAGIAIAAYKWLENRGAWERAVLDVARLYETGAHPDASDGDGNG
jgi:Na+-driven multidrug efflux pump